jgi:hypothetical protein
MSSDVALDGIEPDHQKMPAGQCIISLPLITGRKELP